MSSGVYERKLKPLPIQINGIEVVKDLGIHRIGSLRKRVAIFKCECGKNFKTTVRMVKGGDRSGCGCVRAKKHITHGRANTKIYNNYTQMKQRCYNKNDGGYKHYGAKGIKVCDEWLNDFQAFYDWAMANGYKEGLSIDRKNSKGNYEPENCQYVTVSYNSMKAMQDRGYILSNYEKKEIREMFKDGVSIRDIHKKFQGKISRFSIGMMLKNEILANTIARDEEISEVVECYFNSNISIRELGRKSNIQRHIITRHIKEAS